MVLGMIQYLSQKVVKKLMEKLKIAKILKDSGELRLKN